MSVLRCEQCGEPLTEQEAAETNRDMETMLSFLNQLFGRTSLTIISSVELHRKCAIGVWNDLRAEFGEDKVPAWKEG